MSDDLSAIHCRIGGRVQAVGYRDFVRRSALSLELTGWARNERDGTVVVHAEGTKSNLERLVERLREGPRLARVDEVIVEWVEPSGVSGFKADYL